MVSDAPAPVPDPAGVHGHVATPDTSVPAQGTVLITEDQKESSDVNRTLALQNKAEKEGRGGVPASDCAPSTADAFR